MVKEIDVRGEVRRKQEDTDFTPWSFPVMQHCSANWKEWNIWVLWVTGGLRAKTVCWLSLGDAVWWWFLHLCRPVCTHSWELCTLTAFWKAHLPLNKSANNSTMHCTYTLYMKKVNPSLMLQNVLHVCRTEKRERVNEGVIFGHSLSLVAGDVSHLWLESIHAKSDGPIKKLDGGPACQITAGLHYKQEQKRGRMMLIRLLKLEKRFAFCKLSKHTV